jgi:hypothetical protein
MNIKRAVSNFLEGKTRPEQSSGHHDNFEGFPAHNGSYNRTVAAASNMSPFRSGILRAPVSNNRLRVANGRV